MFQDNVSDDSKQKQALVWDDVLTTLNIKWGIHFTVYKLKKMLVLVGLMGAGKTSVGKKLAENLNVGFLDADHEIEIAAGMSIVEIFEKLGED